MVAKSKISQGIKNLQNNLGFTRDEAIKISCDNITKSFTKKSNTCTDRTAGKVQIQFCLSR